jgi:hypothetical protein
MRQIAVRLRLALAMLALMLGAGRGLPGLVTALSGATTHVCTCASGGDHASCPVCNASLSEHRRSHRPAARGVPCGDPRVAVGAPGEAGTLPAPLQALAAAREWVAAPRTEKAEVPLVFLEPSTPPPRRRAT